MVYVYYETAVQITAVALNWNPVKEKTPKNLGAFLNFIAMKTNILQFRDSFISLSFLRIEVSTCESPTFKT